MEKIIKTKKFALGLGVLSAATVPIATAISCGEDKKEYKIKSQYDEAMTYNGQKLNKKLGYLLSDPENPRWQKSKEYMDIYGKKMFASVIGDIIKKANAQTNYIREKAASVDGFIVAGENSTIAGAFDRFSKSKPLVSFDRIVKTKDRDAYNWYVTFDNLLVGKIQGLAILNKIYDQNWTLETENSTIQAHIEGNQLAEKKIVLALAGSPTDNNAKLFFEGALEKLKIAESADANFDFPQKYHTFGVVAIAGWNYPVGQAKLKDFISELKGEKTKIAAVLSPNDGFAASAISALELSGLDPTKIFITGQDSNKEAILSIAGKENPGQDMTISKPDSFATAVAAALMSVILSDTNKYNLAPNLLNPSDKDNLINQIKQYFPKVEFVYDGVQYKTDGTKLPINTLILTPQKVTSENIGAGKIFEITES